MEYFTIGIISYLIGSIPFGFILTKTFLKKDIRSIGSGNIGATNVLRTGGFKLGLITLMLDIFKGFTHECVLKIDHFRYETYIF